jgi:hypothetical protein
VRPDLGASFEEFDLAAEREGFIAPLALPIMDVPLQTANFSRIPVEELSRDGDTNRAPGGAYNRDQMTFEQDNYSCKEHGFEEPLDDRERQMYAYSFDAEMYAAQRSLSKVLRGLEIEVAAAVFNTTTWTGSALTTSVSTPWSTSASATPIKNVLDAHDKIRSSSQGLLPNALILSWRDFKNLQFCADIIQRLQYSGLDDPKKVTKQQLAALFQVDQVIVAGSMRNTAAQGQTLSASSIWTGGYAMLCRLPKSSDFKEICIGRIMHWNADGSSSRGTVEQYRDEPKRSDVFRARMDYDVKILYPQAGHLLTALSS